VAGGSGMPRPPLSVPLRRSFGGRRVETSSRNSPTRAPARELSPTSPTRPTQRAIPSRCTRSSPRPGPSRRRRRASRTACQRRRCRFSTGSAPPSGSGRGNLTRPHAGGRRAAVLPSSIPWGPNPRSPLYDSAECPAELGLSALGSLPSCGRGVRRRLGERGTCGPTRGQPPSARQRPSVGARPAARRARREAAHRRRTAPARPDEPRGG
jgi:hypothetical protein